MVKLLQNGLLGIGLLLSVTIAAEPITSIVNFHQIDERLFTSGQVLPEHVPGVAELDVELVINLAVADEDRNGQEGFLLTREGIDYVQIPVVWDSPTDDDLALFFAVMDGRSDRKTLVHCFANYRASAFTFLYRVVRQGVDPKIARQDLNTVWNEEAFAHSPQWQSFIDRHLNASVD